VCKDIEIQNRYREISKAIYWKHNKQLLNGIVEYKDKVDGIIYLSVFPCGTDSLANDISIRKVNHIPTLNIVLDEQKANAGIVTRLESFLDIIEQTSKVVV
jgi:predicted nucleotide-binding protein (sugar kinase/HSP70/actin superfamily)